MEQSNVRWRKRAWAEGELWAVGVDDGPRVHRIRAGDALRPHYRLKPLRARGERCQGGERWLCRCIASVAGQGDAGSWSVLGTASFWGSLVLNARKKKKKPKPTITWNNCKTRVPKSTTRSFLEAPAGAASLLCSSASCPGRQGGGLDVSPSAPLSSLLDPPSCPGKGRHLPVLGSA